MALLAAGTRIGSFDIAATLGVGGMGEVYRARDTRLARDVALKVLPSSLTLDADRLARFSREAQLLASLNHPNIASIYGVEESEGVRALVLELVDGPTLAERLMHGAMPPREAVPIARQLARALEAAHDRAIVHRDLKPANVKLTTDGAVKVLDFGLAKALDSRPSGIVEVAESPTLTAHGTGTGVILGTAAYMAPEQARGRPVDRRADIWAFGVVLYEMLSGKPAFDGETIADVLARVIESEPDWRQLPADTPSSIRRLLQRCLTKDPRCRLRDIGDAVLELDDTAIAEEPAARSSTRPSRGTALRWGAAMLATGLLGSALAWSLRSAPSAPPLVRFGVPVPSHQGMLNPALAPDGSFLVYAADRLYVHRFDRNEARPVVGTEHATGPFISPDGRWLGYVVDGKLRKISVSGGEPITICDASGDLPGATWGPGNTILFTPAWGAGLSMVSADGGRPETLTTPDRSRNEKGHWWPQLLPDGKRVLFTIWMSGAGLKDAKVAVLDLESRTYRVLFPGAMARYAAGHVVFYRGTGYHAISVDPATLRTLGEPMAVFADARPPDGEGTSLRPLTLSDNGTAAYMPGAAGYPVVFDWIDRKGQRTHSGAAATRFVDADLSRDGRRIAVSETSGGVFSLTVHDLERRTTESVADEGSNWTGRWAPDSERLAVTSLRKGEFDIYLSTAAGGLRPLLATDLDESPLGWAPDGRLLFKEWLADGTIRLAALDVGSMTKTVLAAGRLEALDAARVSPSGRWLSLVSTQSGQRELYVLGFPNGGRLTRISSSGVGGGWLAGPWVTRAVWSASSPELFYRRGDELMAVSYSEQAGEFRVLSERVLFRLPAFELIGISPDGSRFLAAIAEAPSPSDGVAVILNWPAQLSRAQPDATPAFR